MQFPFCNIVSIGKRINSTLKSVLSSGVKLRRSFLLPWNSTSFCLFSTPWAPYLHLSQWAHETRSHGRLEAPDTEPLQSPHTSGVPSRANSVQLPCWASSRPRLLVSPVSSLAALPNSHICSHLPSSAWVSFFKRTGSLELWPPKAHPGSCCSSLKAPLYS